MVRSPASGTNVILETAALSFVISRALFFTLVIAGSQAFLLEKTYGNSVWETRIELMSARFAPELVRTTLIADGWWYRGIYLNGYDKPGTTETPNWAFFPLFPLLVHAARFTNDFPLDGLIVSNIAFGIALVLLGLIAMRSGCDEETAKRAIMYLAFFPTSYFCSLPLTEGTFLCLSLACVAAALADQWLLGSAFGCLAALTRFTGILLFPVIILLALAKYRRVTRQSLSALLIPVATIAFMVYQRAVTGDFLAFVHAQSHWRRTATWFFVPIVDYFRHPALISDRWNPLLLNLICAVLLFIIGIDFLARRDWAFGVYTLASVLVPLSTGSMHSIDRYIVTVFPVYLWIAKRFPNSDRWILPSFATLYGALMVAFIGHLDFALA